MNILNFRAYRWTVAAALGVVAMAPSQAGADAGRDRMQRGKEAFVSQCLNCHQTVDEAAGGYRMQPAWQRIVADMVARGAKLDEAQQEAVVEYVSGRMLMVAKCSSCHTSNRPLTASKSLEEWKGSVENMVQRMPPNLRPTAEQIEKLTLFLAVERPRP